KPLYLGESIAPFRLLKPAEAVIPWSTKSARLLDSASARDSGYNGLAEWLRQGEKLWNRHSKAKLTLLERLDKFHALMLQMPAPALRVIYTKSGTIAAAAALLDRTSTIDHKLYWSGIADHHEARYLVAFLNSDALRRHVAPLQSRGQWGARDFDKLLAGTIPPFDQSDHLHMDLAVQAAHAEKVAAAVVLPEDIHFIRARGMIRDALRGDGVSMRIDALVERILDGRKQAISIS
ncbi:MAG: N-6 DNA methylase, partial [Candidatus Binataceae bacterium]